MNREVHVRILWEPGAEMPPATRPGQPGQGLGLANAALKQRGHRTPRLHAVVLRQRANAYAMLHEPSNFARDAEEAFKQAIVGTSQGELT